MKLNNLCNLGPQAQSIANTNRIGNKVGLHHIPKAKPKPREICPRFHPSPLMQTSSIRSRNATPRLGTDKMNKTPTKKPSTFTTSVQSKARPQSSQTSKSATPSIKSVDSARIRAQSAKPNAKSNAKSNAKPTAV